MQLWTKLWTTVILEAGRKFSFEIKKHENPIVVWNYLSTIMYFLSVSGYFQICLGCFLLFPKAVNDWVGRLWNRRLWSEDRASLRHSV